MDLGPKLEPEADPAKEADPQLEMELARRKALSGRCPEKAPKKNFEKFFFASEIFF